MQYSPLAIATVATEAAQDYISTVQPDNRELVARVWADLTREVIFDPVTGRTEGPKDAYSWNLVLFDVMEEFTDWLERHALFGSPVDHVGSAVLDACNDFVNLER